MDPSDFVVNNNVIEIIIISTSNLAAMRGTSMSNANKTGQLHKLFCFSVYSTGIAINRLYEPLLDPHELNYR